MASDDGRDLSAQDKPRDSTRADWSNVFWRVVLIVLGLGAVISFVANVWKGFISVDWPTAGGKVISSSIEEDAEGYYGASVTYSYEVAGVHHQGQDVHVSEMHWGNGRDHALATVDKYPAGAAVVVHYNPVSPGTAVLEPGPNWDDFGILLIAALFLWPLRYPVLRQKPRHCIY